MNSGGALGITRYELLKVIGQTFPLDIAAGLNFAGDVRRDVFGPVLKGVEGNHADGIVKLPCQQVGDDALEIYPLDFAFAADAAQPAEAVDNEIYGLVRAVGHG